MAWSGSCLIRDYPRFAPTSTPEQLERAGQLKAEFPDVYVHTHLSENKDEKLHGQGFIPSTKGYLDVYHHYGLTGTVRCLHIVCI